MHHHGDRRRLQLQPDEQLLRRCHPRRTPQGALAFLCRRVPPPDGLEAPYFFFFVRVSLLTPHTFPGPLLQVWDTSNNALHATRPADLSDPARCLSWEISPPQVCFVLPFRDACGRLLACEGAQPTQGFRCMCLGYCLRLLGASARCVGAPTCVYTYKCVHTISSPTSLAPLHPHPLSYHAHLCGHSPLGALVRLIYRKSSPESATKRLLRRIQSMSCWEQQAAG